MFLLVLPTGNKMVTWRAHASAMVKVVTALRASVCLRVSCPTAKHRGTPGPQSGQKRRPLLSPLKRQDAPLFQVLHIIQVASNQHYCSVPTTTCSLPHHLSAPKLLPRSDWSPGKANAGDHPPPPARARPPRGAPHPSRLCPSRLLRPATLQSKRT